MPVSFSSLFRSYILSFNVQVSSLSSLRYLQPAQQHTGIHHMTGYIMTSNVALSSLVMYISNCLLTTITILSKKLCDTNATGLCTACANIQVNTNK